MNIWINRPRYPLMFSEASVLTFPPIRKTLRIARWKYLFVFFFTCLETREGSNACTQTEQCKSCLGDSGQPQCKYIYLFTRHKLNYVPIQVLGGAS